MSIAGAARIALSTGSLYNWSLDRVFGLAEAAGYDGVELLVDARMESYDEGYVGDLCRRHNIPVLSVHTPFAARMEGWAKAPEKRLQQAVTLAERLGAETVVAHLPLRWAWGHVQVALGQLVWRWGFPLPWRDREGARYARWLAEELPAFQAGTAVRIAIENMPARRAGRWRVDVYSCGQPERLLHFPHLVLDTTHWGTMGVDPLAVYERLGDRVAHVHLADYDGREHRLPFKGHLGLERLLEKLGSSGFAGVVTIEAEPWAVAEGDWSAAGICRRLRDTADSVRALLAPSHSQSATPQGPAPSSQMME